MGYMANYTKKAIIQTFENMLREMPFDKITVSAIVTRCEISPNTFYYHFRDIYDLVDTWLDTKLFKYQTDAWINENWKDVMRTILCDIQDDQEIVSHLFTSNSRERLEHYLFNSLENNMYHMIQKRDIGKSVSEETKRVLSSTLCYLLLGFIFNFIWNGMKNDINQMFDQVVNFLDSGITYYVNQKILEEGESSY